MVSQLRAAFPPAHPLTRQDAPFTQARAFPVRALGECSYLLPSHKGGALCGFLLRALSEHRLQSHHAIVLVCALSEPRKLHNAPHLPFTP